MTNLSVITINYNNAEGLEKTLESVANQTFQNFEYIVIDGGSKDESVEVINKYKSHITYSISEKDNGIYDAMNKGIAVAKGEYCLFLNSGDYLIDKKILDKVFAQELNEDILYGELVFDNGAGETVVRKLPQKLTLNYMFNDNIWHPATFIKRTLFASIGIYNEKYKIAADYDFFFHAIAIKNIPSAYLPFPITIYDNAKGISIDPLNFKKIAEERFLIHNSYMSEKEINFHSNLKKFKNQKLALYLSNNPKVNNCFNYLLRIYSSLRA